MHYGQALRIATEYLAGSMISRLFAAIIAASLLASAMACAFAQTRPVPGQTPASVIDLNTASRDDLMTLDGIGEVRADAIIRARPAHAVARPSGGDLGHPPERAQGDRRVDLPDRAARLRARPRGARSGATRPAPTGAAHCVRSL